MLYDYDPILIPWTWNVENMMILQQLPTADDCPSVILQGNSSPNWRNVFSFIGIHHPCLIHYPLVNQHDYGKSPCWMGNSTIFAIFHSYVNLPEGIYWYEWFILWKYMFCPHWMPFWIGIPFWNTETRSIYQLDRSWDIRSFIMCNSSTMIYH